MFLFCRTALESISAQHQVELEQARQEAARGDSTSMKPIQDKIHELEIQLEAKDQVSISSNVKKTPIFIYSDILDFLGQ